MGDLIQRLINAIFRQEGRPADSTNPGNLRDCPWYPMKAVGDPTARPVRLARTYNDSGLVEYSGGFWVPRSRAEGVAGAAHVVALHIAEGNTLTQLISIWAPPSDHNDTAAYIKHAKEWAGIPDETVPLWNFILPQTSVSASTSSPTT